MKRFVSLKTKAAALVALIVFLCAAAFSFIGIYHIHKQARDDAIKVMALTCESSATDINDQLLEVEYATNAVARYVAETVPAEADIEQDYAVFEDHLEGVQAYFDSLVSLTPGIHAYYYRYLPEKYATTAGIFCTDEDGDGVFEPFPLTDITQFERNDEERSGWWYIPHDTGESLWMDPYWNANDETYTLSYVVPVIRDGEVVAVVGIDLDFEELSQSVLDISAYETGRACLLTTNGEIVAHNTIEAGAYVNEVDPTLQVLVDDLGNADSGETLYTYERDGVKMAATFCSLRNGMKLVLAAPVSEIHSPMRSALIQYALASAVVLLVLLPILAKAVGSVLKPLLTLTDSARQIGSGNLNVKFPDHTNDEIGVLSDTMQSMAGELGKLVGGLSAKAYRDALTGVRNKGAFEEEAKVLNKGDERFGLVMFDLNRLKYVNDTFGHDHGDTYLKTACAVICEAFSHCPVFRMGGDEFVAILNAEHVDQADVLLAQMDELVADINAEAEHPWKRVDCAKGVAIYDPVADAGVHDPVEVVLKRADKAMYADKGASRRSSEGSPVTAPCEACPHLPKDGEKSEG